MCAARTAARSLPGARRHHESPVWSRDSCRGAKGSAASRTPRSLVAACRGSSSRRAPVGSGALLILKRPTGRDRACHRAPGAREPRARRRQSSRMDSSLTACGGRSSPSTGIGTVGWSRPANHPAFRCWVGTERHGERGSRPAGVRLVLVPHPEGIRERAS
jgi:hypothetical protein